MSHDLLVQMAYSVGPHLDQCYLHKPVHPIMLAHSILMRRFSLALWIPWRHFWNEFQVLQHLKEQDFKSCVMPREINYLVWASVPQPANTCGTLSGDLHTFGTWHLKFLFQFFEVPFQYYYHHHYYYYYYYYYYKGRFGITFNTEKDRYISSIHYGFHFLKSLTKESISKFWSWPPQYPYY